MNRFHPQQGKAGHGTNHIHDGIDSTDLVKMDLIHRYAVYGRFRLRQVPEYGQTSFLYGGIQGTALQQPLDISEMAMTVSFIGGHHNLAAGAHERTTPFRGNLQAVAGNPERAQRPAQILGTQPGIQQSPKQHVAANP